MVAHCVIRLRDTTLVNVYLNRLEVWKFCMIGERFKMISKAKGLDACIGIAMQVRCGHCARIVHAGLSLSRLQAFEGGAENRQCFASNRSADKQQPA